MERIVLFIDDDETTNHLNKTLLDTDFPKIEVLTFDNSQKAFEFIYAEANSSLKAKEILIFLDIQMPGLDGYEFIEELESVDLDSLIDLKIYILNSEITKRTLEKKFVYPMILDVLEKPLKASKFSTLL